MFGDTALVREWGRLGGHGQRRLDLFDGHVQRRLSPGSSARPVVVTYSGTFAWSRLRRAASGLIWRKSPIKVCQSNPKVFRIYSENCSIP
nr:hypothetical protein [Bradyrhizobium zhengyangense]